MARVHAHVPDFTLDEHNAAALAEICRQLDGLPLALELVAARVESLGIAEVAARLSDRFALAVGAGRTVPARQRTLQATLAWSHSLLAEDERVLLRRLAVFVGGWTLGAAEAICGGNDATPGSGVGGAASSDAVVDTLGRLVTKSLVVAQHTGLTVRYRLLETVRAYALTQLKAAHETDALQRRHAAFILALAERAPPESVDVGVAALLRPEEDNVRAVLEWAVRERRVELGLRLATAAYPMWTFTGHYAEGSSWLDRLLALPEAVRTPAVSSMGLTFNAQLRHMQGEYALADAYGRAALEEHESHADARGVAATLSILGNVALHRGDLARAGALHAEAARRLHELGNPGEVVSLLQSGLVAWELGDTDHVRQLAAEVEAIARVRRQPHALALVLHLRALVAARDGDSLVAARFLLQALALCRSVGDQQGTVTCLTTLGHVRLDQGQAVAALALFVEAVQGARTSGEQVRLIRAVEGVARGLAARDADAAVQLAGATDGQRNSIGTALWPSERRRLEHWLADARRMLGQNPYRRAWDDGHASTLDQAVSLAEVLAAVPSPAASLTDVLTPREHEVAILLARGLTNKRIAAELIVSPATVRSHVEHILAKLDLRSRAQIAVWATQHGLLAGEMS